MSFILSLLLFIMFLLVRLGSHFYLAFCCDILRNVRVFSWGTLARDSLLFIMIFIPFFSLFWTDLCSSDEYVSLFVSQQNCSGGESSFWLGQFIGFVFLLLFIDLFVSNYLSKSSEPVKRASSSESSASSSEWIADTPNSHDANLRKRKN